MESLVDIFYIPLVCFIYELMCKIGTFLGIKAIIVKCYKLLSIANSEPACRAFKFKCLVVKTKRVFKIYSNISREVFWR